MLQGFGLDAEGTYKVDMITKMSYNGLYTGKVVVKEYEYEVLSVRNRTGNYGSFMG